VILEWEWESVLDRKNELSSFLFFKVVTFLAQLFSYVVVMLFS
jgi:hypothetical protein